MDFVAGFSIIYSIVSYIMVSIGLWHLFKKCDVESWWAVIPVVRLYKVSTCANREGLGIRLMVTCFLSYTLQFVYLVVSVVQSGNTVSLETLSYVPAYSSDAVSGLLTSIRLAVVITQCVYSVRVYLGLCEAFGRKKTWIWGWIFLEPWVSLLWGLNPKFRKMEQNNVPEYPATQVES